MTGWKHGTRYAWVKKGCHCAECRAARLAEDRARRRSRRERTARGEVAVPHGALGYRDYGCRCDECRRAHNAERLTVQRAKGVLPRQRS